MDHPGHSDGIPVRTRLVHLADRGLPVAVLAIGAVTLAALTHALPERAADAIASIAAFWTLAAVFHRGPCLACAAALPLNPAERAESHLTALRVFHAVSRRATRTRGWLVLGIGVAALLIPSALGFPQGSGAVSVLFAVTLGPLLMCMRTHAALRPWCPWCRDGGGSGAGRPAPDPGVRRPA